MFWSVQIPNRITRVILETASPRAPSPTSKRVDRPDIDQLIASDAVVDGVEDHRLVTVRRQDIDDVSYLEMVHWAREVDAAHVVADDRVSGARRGAVIHLGREDAKESINLLRAGIGDHETWLGRADHRGADGEGWLERVRLIAPEFD